MPTVFSAISLLVLTSSSFAASFNWIDRDGFHSVDLITDVPLTHRKDLPLVKNQMAKHVKPIIPVTEGISIVY